jgi:hypothetical protein
MLCGATARRGALVLILAVLLVPFGVPRVLDRSRTPTTSQPDATFAAVCRDHGGSPTTAAAPAQRACVVRYGRRVYRMDAITSTGFDEDAARFQRRGCREARRRAPPPSSGGGVKFVFHPATAVCERRP